MPNLTRRAIFEQTAREAGLPVERYPDGRYISRQTRLSWGLYTFGGSRRYQLRIPGTNKWLDCSAENMAQINEAAGLFETRKRY